MMKKFAMAAISGMTVAVIATTQIAPPLLAQDASRDSSVYEQLDLFGDVFERIRNQYVEDVDPSDLVEAAIDGMLSSLDPHSSYHPPEQADDLRVQTRGEFGGLGIEVTQEEGFVKVVTPMDDTPAYDAGIEAGDYITHVDGRSVLGLTLDDAVKMMRGPVGSEIVITVVREGEPEPFDVTIVRDTIKLTVVRARTESDSIVLRVSAFNRQTYPTMVEKLNEEIEAAGGLDNVNGIVARPAQQPRWPAGSGDPAVRRLPRQRRDRLHPRT